MRRFYPSVLIFLLISGLWVTSAAQTAAAGNAQTPSNADQVNAPADTDDTPTTVKTASDAASKKPVDTDPLFGVPPLPKGTTTLVGGTVNGIDGVHNRLHIKVFEGGKWTIAFDERTHFYRDGSETTFEKIKKGDRIYVDTMLDKHQVFARNVHIVTHLGAADATGQVTAFNGGQITLHDDLSAQPVQFRVDGNTTVKRNGGAGSVSDIQQGSLVTVQFSPNGVNRGTARVVTILASPGQTFTFAGKVMNLDLRNNQVAIQNNADDKTYDIALDRDQLPQNLNIGSDVTVAAVFDGKQYKASSIEVK
jgi:Domain of unknown function (DUF5666)